jgi:hypothetical protein
MFRSEGDRHQPCELVPVYALNGAGHTPERRRINQPKGRVLAIVRMYRQPEEDFQLPEGQRQGIPKPCRPLVL